MDDLVYTKYKKPQPSPADDSTPSLVQLQEKQERELIEISQIRFGIKGGSVNINLTSLQFNPSMGEGDVFKVLLGAPENERADQVLYGLAKGNLTASMANKILASLALLGKFKKIKID
ncbi:hypothetical protein DCO17_03200 [Polynucleobacter tropicus]|uniref:Uncharacterized protein n=1 Tax=Polynucleobacter tropicus TaxID=1743174 RepID=A0A6M9PYC2_9BURK|nr:hypothetical protein [Polynucleobacter tropicus]QKM64328.1 hypothetical protein DCO17_03200 [Polynucleobacter tropicus]